MIGPNGEDLTPRSKKACALLALLAFSPSRSRTRAALQDKLWSDRGPEQGATSLRGELTNIRRAFGSFREHLVADTIRVALSDDHVSVDLQSVNWEQLLANGIEEAPELMEGLEPRDREIQHWLRDRRAEFEAELEARAKDIHRPPAVPIIDAPSVWSTKPERPWVRIQCTGPNDDSGSLIARVVGNAIARGIEEQGTVDICHHPRDGMGIELDVSVFPDGDQTLVSVTVTTGDGEKYLWSTRQLLRGSLGSSLESGDLTRMVNQCVDISIKHLRDLVSESDENYSFALAFDAVQNMYRLDANALSTADRQLRQAFERSSRPVYLAWLAYLQTFLLGESNPTERSAIEVRAREYASKALKEDPGNSTVAALCSHVFGFVLQDYTTSHELAARSLDLNPGNALGRAFLGRAKSYLGEVEMGYALTEAARHVSGIAPYKTTIELLTGVTAAVAGRHSEAIRIAEVSRTLEPRYRAPLRYLFALYLKEGRSDDARILFEHIRSMEPDFCLELLQEQWYPSDGLRHSGLLQNLPNDDF
ncbi:MAG: hypothetical protein AAF493_04060 [Pseudomonadota bacterium]